MFSALHAREARCASKIDSLKEAIVEIVYPEQGKERSRAVVSRSRSRGTGKYPSWKMRRMLQWESHNELNAFRLLDACEAVTAYREQPLMLRFLMDGNIHNHYPDLMVEFGVQRELWEVKPLREALRPDVTARTSILESALPAWGFNYRMVIGEELRREPRLSTIGQFLKYGREPIDELAREHVRCLLMATRQISWSLAVSGDLGSRGRAVVSRLVLEGELVCDFEQPLCPSTLFSWRQSESRLFR